MLNLITHIENINQAAFTVTCRFNNGEVKLIDLKPWVEEFAKLNNNWSSKLSNPEYFGTVSLDEYGTLSWNNGVDFCPDVLFEMGQTIKL